MRFKDKTVMITGSGSGIGRATALAFAVEGAKVLVSDINADGAEATAKMIAEKGGNARFLQADVANQSNVQQLISETLAIFGSLDIAINNAGISGEFSPTHSYSLEGWEKVIAVNQTGVFYCMREELKVMAKQGSGAIVNVSSIAGLRAMANASAYVASKHAVLGLTKTAAVEYARHNIRVNAICPVFTRSPLFDAMFKINPDYEEKLKRNIPMRRYGQPEDIADAILWLCSESAGFITGVCLPADGGMMA